MSTAKSNTQSKLEAARAEHAARKATMTHESEPDTVHAAAIEDVVDAAPSWTRKIIGFVAGLFASAATYYYGALAANMLLAAIGGGFLGFVAYLLCVLILFLASAVAGWATNSLVSGGTAVSVVTGMVSGWFSKTKAAAVAMA